MMYVHERKWVLRLLKGIHLRQVKLSQYIFLPTVLHAQRSSDIQPCHVINNLGIVNFSFIKIFFPPMQGACLRGILTLK